MLTGIHILLTYKCTFECDHCFLYAGPYAEGTLTLSQVRKILDESREIGTVEWIYFEGGEPFLYYPLLLEAIRSARNMDFKVGIVSNAYYATSVDDAELWLQPLSELGIMDLSISDDLFHHEEKNDNLAKNALSAAQKLGIPVSSICIEKPYIESIPGNGQEKGHPVIGGGAMFKGRAVEKLTTGLPHRPFREFVECPYEELTSPSRVHIDPYGHVHLCQGISMGNMWEHPLSDIAKEYTVDTHPICGPLVKGGPALLAEQNNVDHEETYIDECHACFLVRKALIDIFPQYLTPKQVYGIDANEDTG
jgi:hypothetical protein